MKWIGAWAASLVALVWSGAPAVFADEVVGRVTASIDAEFGGPIADGEHLQLDCEPHRDPGYEPQVPNRFLNVESAN